MRRIDTTAIAPNSPTAKNQAVAMVPAEFRPVTWCASSANMRNSTTPSASGRAKSQMDGIFAGSTGDPTAAAAYAVEAASRLDAQSSHSNTGWPSAEAAGLSRLAAETPAMPSARLTTVTCSDV